MLRPAVTVAATEICGRAPSVPADWTTERWIHGSKARQEAQEQENAGDSPLDSSGWREPWAGETGANGTREERCEYGTGR
jgi:hypothetical protein